MLSKMSREWKPITRAIADGRDDYETVRAICEILMENGFSWHMRYGERGYVVEEGKKGILLGDWNDVPDTIESFLESRYHLEWCGEWTVYYDDEPDYPIYRTVGDSFCWYLSFVIRGHDEIIPYGVIEREWTSEQGWYVESYLRNTGRVNRFSVPLANYGFIERDGVEDRSSIDAALKATDSALYDTIVDGMEGSFLHVWTRPKVRVTEKDEGCFADCARGHYIGVEVIRVALNLGWHPVEDYSSLIETSIPADEWRELLTSRAIADHESYDGLWSEAEEWLNEHHKPEKHYWGPAPCEDGSWGLWRENVCDRCGRDLENDYTCDRCDNEDNEENATNEEKGETA